MSDDIRIQFEREPVFRSGEAVSGVIVIDDYDGRRIEEVMIRAGWMAIGEGFEYDGHHGTLVVQEGPLVGTGEHRIPFRFMAPLEPMSYRGHLLRVGHLLEARARVEGGADLVTERDFELVPGTGVAPAPEPASEGKLPAGRRKTAGVQAAIGFALVVSGVITLPVPGLPLLLIGLLFLGSGMRRSFARGRLGEVVLLVHPRILAPGDEVRVAAAVGPPRVVKINGITATLRATEVVARGSSSNRKTERHEVYSEQVQLTGARQLEKGKEVLFETPFTIPDEGIWSFRTANGSVEWEVVLEVSLPSWPDWVTSSPLVVHPRAQPALAGRTEEQPRVAARPEALPASTATAPEPTAPVSTAPRPPEPKAAVPPTPAESRSGVRPERRPEARPERPSEPRPDKRREQRANRRPEPRPDQHRNRRPDTRANRRPEPRPDQRPDPRPDSRPDPQRQPQPGTSPATAAAAATPPPADRAPARSPFETAVAEVLSAGVVTGKRRELAARIVGKTVRCTLVIDRIDRPFGRRLPPAWAKGRVVRARFADTGHEVEVLIPADRAAEVDRLARGATLEVEGVVSEWARLPDRPVVRQKADA